MCYIKQNWHMRILGRIFFFFMKEKGFRRPVFVPSWSHMVGFEHEIWVSWRCGGHFSCKYGQVRIQSFNVLRSCTNIFLFFFIFQECVVRIVVKLLSPPLLSDSPVSGDTSSYLPHMHMLSAVLSCLAHVDVIHILSLYGVVSFWFRFFMDILYSWVAEFGILVFLRIG